MGETTLVLELIQTLEDLEKYKEEHKLEYYQPYDFQLAFHNARAGNVYESGKYKETIKQAVNDAIAEERALICANQIGKTLSAGMETAYHATGIYPDWWEGIRFEYAPVILCIGQTNDSVMKIIQNELLGNPLEQPQSWGTGSIPKDKIVKVTRKAGVPNAVSSITVQHISGKRSSIWMMAYEQDAKAMMGIRADVIWPDEEPPQDIMSQLKRAQISRKKKTIYSTFTPESGVTEVVDQLLNHMLPYQAVIRATWDDAPHMTPERREKELSKFPPHERAMRSKGIPLMGSGLIYPVNDEHIMVDPFNIPDHWSRICGVDFGIDHPFAAAWLAHDRDTDTVYVYDVYRESGQTIPTHVSAVNKRGNWIPVIWPHDGLKRDSRSGVPLADLYRTEGMNMWPDKFSNPPAPGQQEGQGGNGVEVGIADIYNRMESGTFKVFSNLSEWFEEKRQYHRKDGKRVEIRDDLMDATRYADMSLRFARTKPVIRKRQSNFVGLKNW